MKFLGHFKNYLGAQIAVKALGFLSIPVLTRLFTPFEYGMLNVFNAYTGYFFILCSLNFSSSIGRYYYDRNINFKRLFGTAIIIIFVILCVTTIGMIVFARPLAVFLKIPVVLVFLMPIVMLINIIDSFFNQIYQAKQASQEIALVSVLKNYSSFGLGILVVLFLSKDKYIGIIVATIFVGIAVSIYLVSLLKSYVEMEFDIEAARKVVSYSLAMLPYALSGLILDQFDRLMINNYQGAADTGLYSFAYNIGVLLTVLSGALFATWMPQYFKLMDLKEYGVINSHIEVLFRFIVIFSCGLILFGKDMGILLAGDKFHGALFIIPFVVLGYLFQSVFSIYAWGMGYFLKVYWVSIIVLLSGALNIVLNRIFIPAYGYQAAAYTTMVSYLFMATAAWLCNQFFLRQHLIPVRPILYALCFPLFVCFLVACFTLFSIGGVVVFIWKIILLFVIAWLLLKKYWGVLGSYFVTNI